MRRRHQPDAVPLSWANLYFPRDLEPEAVRGFIASVIADRSLGPVVFEVTGGRVAGYRVGSRNLQRVLRMLTAFVPLVQTATARRFVQSDCQALRLQLSTKKRALDTSDPIAASARLLGALATQSSAVHQLVLGQSLAPMAVPNRLEAVPGETWGAALAGAAFDGKQRVDNEARRAIADKQGQLGSRVNVRLVHDGRSASGYEAALRSLVSPGLGLRLRPDDALHGRLAEVSKRSSVPLNVDELVALLGWPYGDQSYPGVDRSGAKVMPPVGQVENPERLIGTSTFPANASPIGMSVDDSLRHLHVLGPTGVGKSTLLLNLILGDIRAGRGAVVIDPKGDLVADVLARVRSADSERVILLDPAAKDQIVGFNPLAVASASQELAVDSLLHIMKELYSSSWGPRTQDILHASLLSLIGTPWASILLVPGLLTDAGFRHQVTDRLSSPHLRQFWKWFESMSEAERSTVISPALNKLRPFLLRTSLRTMLGQVEPKTDFGSVFADNHVLLVPLRKGEVGAETASLLGSMIVAQLWQLAMARTGVSASSRSPVMMYLDEFQDYLRLPTDLADVLAQARGLGVGLTLAHQHLAQLRPDVKAAVLANAQTRVVFRLGADDANVFGRTTDQLDALDFRGLGRYQIYADVLGGGEPSGWMSAQTPRPSRTLRSAVNLASQLSQRDGVGPASVDEFLASVVSEHGPAPEPGSVGRRKRGQS